MPSNVEAISSAAHVATHPSALSDRSDWATLRRLLPYLWLYKWRVIGALAFMVGAKMASIGIVFLFKDLVDAVAPKLHGTQAALVVPITLLVAYGLLRFCGVLFGELRELVFANATEGAARSIALEVFGHLHALSLRFHLERQTGGIARDVERGTRGVRSLISISLYSVLPTIIELALVLVIFGIKFDVLFVWIIVVALLIYIVFTVKVTEWCTQFRKTMNEFDSVAQSHAVDSLLNYETVKYFDNEEFEALRYDASLDRYRCAAIKSKRALSVLTTGQQLLISISLVLVLLRATAGVVEGRMTLGDLVMIQAFMIQLYLPLNFLGVIYREIKQSLIDLDTMFALMEEDREVRDMTDAKPLAGVDPTVRFEEVSFSYDAARLILDHVSFEIPAGKTVAVVGPSGSGKSTLARLMHRFYDVQQGRITIGGEDIRDVAQASVRQAIGIVPQDTVLFNDSIEYNIAYGRPSACHAEVESAARAAHIHDFIAAAPEGYETVVGERGLKLSGGEKQRVAIARALLKNPPILIFDEATSALDSANERAIQSELKSAARNKTTLVIAHRLSTVVDAHEILVLERGEIVERGTHAALLARRGKYAQMWALQKIEAEPLL
jgi:ATP-binding cassette subfamily B protein